MSDITELEAIKAEILASSDEELEQVRIATELISTLVYSEIRRRRES